MKTTETTPTPKSDTGGSAIAASSESRAIAWARGVFELSELLRRCLILLEAPDETVNNDGDMAHVAWWLSQRERAALAKVRGQEGGGK